MIGLQTTDQYQTHLCSNQSGNYLTDSAEPSSSVIEVINVVNGLNSKGNVHSIASYRAYIPCLVSLRKVFCSSEKATNLYSKFLQVSSLQSRFTSYSSQITDNREYALLCTTVWVIQFYNVKSVSKPAMFKIDIRT